MDVSIKFRRVAGTVCLMDGYLMHALFSFPKDRRRIRSILDQRRPRFRLLIPTRRDKKTAIAGGCFWRPGGRPRRTGLFSASLRICGEARVARRFRICSCVADWPRRTHGSKSQRVATKKPPLLAVVFGDPYGIKGSLRSPFCGQARVARVF